MIKIDENFIERFDMLKLENKPINFFDIISPKEVIVSEWLSFILDPSINGIGNKTIEKLLESIDIVKELDEYEFISTNTEVTTDTNQRMDIVIKYNGLWIIIENKVESHENGNQTESYYKYIESIKDDNEVIYIYLKPNYNISIPKEKEFKILTYNKLIKKLKEISEFDYKEKDKYKYLKEFLVSGVRFMKNDELDFSNAVRFYINNKDKMHQIENEYKEQNKRLHNKIRYDVLNHLREKDDSYITDDDKGTSPRTYIQFYKSSWKNNSHMGVHFELMFHTDQLLANKIECDVVLHLENRITEEDMKSFNKEGITRNRTQGCFNGVPISNQIVLTFNSNETYKESMKKILIEIDNLVNKYEFIIDKTQA